jgi:hypothetical protein
VFRQLLVAGSDLLEDAAGGALVAPATADRVLGARVGQRFGLTLATMQVVELAGAAFDDGEAVAARARDRGRAPPRRELRA